jgi:hypothetical protein
MPWMLAAAAVGVNYGWAGQKKTQSLCFAGDHVTFPLISSKSARPRKLMNRIYAANGTGSYWQNYQASVGKNDGYNIARTSISD